MNKISKLLIITPVKNEIGHLHKTIKSVLDQSFKPTKWLIIDDSSSDGSYEFALEATKNVSWIQVVPNNCVFESEKGSRIAKIINEYVRLLKMDVDYISKLDADTSFDSNFFESLIKAMEADPSLGICSGTLSYNGKKETNIFPFMTRGATKLYRRLCFEEIGGLLESTGWDTFDNIKAQMKGWTTLMLEPIFEHHKPEGKTQGFINKYFHAGRYYGRIPYYFPFFLVKIVYRVFEPPFLISSILLMFGYIDSRLIKRDLFEDRESCNYFRDLQKKMLYNKFGF